MINLEDFLAVGQNAIARRVVQQSDCADNYENDFKGLLSTPRLIHWALDASIEAIDPYLPDDYASISLGVSFVHTAPTSIGMTVTVHAAIIAITDHDVTLDVKAWDEQGEIAHGTHRRAIVLKEDVLKKVEERARLLMIRQANEQIKEMTMIPDTLEGALLLSAIDFVLSFVFISFIGVILHFFPLLNKLGEVRERRD